MACGVCEVTIGRRWLIKFAYSPLILDQRVDKRSMILNDSVAVAVLSAIYQAANGRAGRIVRLADAKRLTDVDPGSFDGAVDELMRAGLLMPGSTDDRVCLNSAGVASARG